MANVWIVGAGGDIGSACHALLEDDNTVFTSDYKQFDPGRFDVCDMISINKYVQNLPPCEVLVYAAGVNRLAWSRDITPFSINYVYDVNVTGMVRCLQAMPSLGRVVVIGSDAARRPMRTSLAYNASKAALEAAVKVIARERAAEGFVINIVAPGLVDGPEVQGMTRYVYQESERLRPELILEEYMLGQIPAGRPATRHEVALVVQWLVNNAPSYVNGSVIDVNGAR